MSSSKVFKASDQFTPMPLVRESLPAPSLPATLEEAEPPPEENRSSPISLDTSLAAENAPPESEPAEEPPPLPDPAPLPPPEPAPDLEAIRQEAYAQGMADQAARLQAELTQAVLALNGACQKLDAQRQHFVEQSRGDLVNLVMALTKKVVGMELATSRTAIVATLKAALEQAIGCEEHYVTLHPDDLALAEQTAPELIASIRGLERIIFRTDPAMTRGGCMLESERGTADATIEGQLESIETLLAEHPELVPNPAGPPEDRPGPGEADKTTPADAAP